MQLQYQGSLALTYCHGPKSYNSCKTCQTGFISAPEASVREEEERNSDLPVRLARQRKNEHAQGRSSFSSRVMIVSLHLSVQ